LHSGTESCKRRIRLGIFGEALDMPSAIDPVRPIHGFAGIDADPRAKLQRASDETESL
jgi:hypothetical protein